MDFEKWKNEVLATSHRDTEEQEKRFLELVDEVEDCCDYEIAKVLMKTFSEKPDYGTQESVISTLCNLSKEEYIQVILEELPRLINEAYEWAECLVGLEIEKRFDYVQKTIKEQNKEIIENLKKLINNKNFVNSYPNAALLKL